MKMLENVTNVVIESDEKDRCARLHDAASSVANLNLFRQRLLDTIAQKVFG